jgi:hypothetical protein
MLYVREEAGEYVFVLASDRVVYTRRYPVEAGPPELELVHEGDEGLRVEVARANEQAVTARADAEELRRERAALAAAMKLAVELHPESARALRDRYREGLKGAV